MQKLFRKFLLLLIFINIAFAYSFPEFDGWEKVDSIRIYTSDNLWNYINGAADIYHDYGFERVKTGKFKSGNKKLTLDIYNMGNQLNAFGIYVYERADQYDPLKIGTEAVFYPPGEINMLKDKYYVILRCQSDTLSESTIKNMMRTVSKELPGKTTFPQILSILPQKNKLSNSESYIKKDFMGMASLKNCILADYKGGEDHYKIFYIVNSQKKNSEVWSKFSHDWENLEKTGKSIKIREVPYQGLIGLIKTKSGVFGVAEMGNKEKIIDILLSIAKN